MKEGIAEKPMRPFGVLVLDVAGDIGLVMGPQLGQMYLCNALVREL